MAELHPTLGGNTAVPKIWEVEVDLSDGATASETVDTGVVIPAGSLVMIGGAEVLEAMAGTSTDATVTVEVGATALTAALDFDAASVGDYATGVYGTGVVAADTALELVFNAFTGTVTGGKVRVYAVVLDVSDRPNPGRALIGS